jgi:hypothetical protein
MNEEEQPQTHGWRPASVGGESPMGETPWCERKGELDVDGDLTALGTDAGINDTNPGLNLVMEYSCPFQSAGFAQPFHNCESLSFASISSKPHPWCFIMTNFSLKTI